MNESSATCKTPRQIQLYIWYKTMPSFMPPTIEGNKVILKLGPNQEDKEFRYAYVENGNEVINPILIKEKTDIVVDVIGEPWGSANTFSCVVNKLSKPDGGENYSSKLSLFEIVNSQTHKAGNQIPIAKPSISGKLEVSANLRNSASILLTIDPINPGEKNTTFKLTIFALYEYRDSEKEDYKHVIIPCDPEIDNDRPS